MPKYIAHLIGDTVAQTTLEILAQSPEGATRIAKDTVAKINAGTFHMDWSYQLPVNVIIDEIEHLEEADA